MFSLLVIVPGDLIVPLPMMTVRISGGREGGRERGEREKRGRERCTMIKKIIYLSQRNCLLQEN